MSNDKTREAFEAWATQMCWSIVRRMNGAYERLDTDLAWEAWQAALSASEGAAPVGAPVAVVESVSGGPQGLPTLLWYVDFPNIAAQVKAGDKLYTTPQPAVNGAGLSDAEIIDIADRFKSQYTHGGTMFDEFDYLGFARAVLDAAPDAQSRPWPMEVQPDGTTVAVDPADLPAQARPVAAGWSDDQVMEFGALCVMNRRSKKTAREFFEEFANARVPATPTAPPAEAVAWQYELATQKAWHPDEFYTGWQWRIGTTKPCVPEGSIRNLRPLVYGDTRPAAPLSEVARLRAEQTAAVMPLIGPLLDAWESSRCVDGFRDDHAELHKCLHAIDNAMEGRAAMSATPGGGK